MPWRQHIEQHKTRATGRDLQRRKNRADSRETVSGGHERELGSQWQKAPVAQPQVLKQRDHRGGEEKRDHVLRKVYHN
jgi:hypothetical protein